MIETEQTIYRKRFKGEKAEARIFLIDEMCQVFRRGFEDDIFTFKELREGCRFLNRRIRSFNRDAGDLCLLASHAENVEQFTPICQLSRQQWESKEKAEKRVEDYVVSRTR